MHIVHNTGEQWLGVHSCAHVCIVRWWKKGAKTKGVSIKWYRSHRLHIHINASVASGHRTYGYTCSHMNRWLNRQWAMSERRQIGKNSENNKGERYINIVIQLLLLLMLLHQTKTAIMSMSPWVHSKLLECSDGGLTVAADTISTKRTMAYILLLSVDIQRSYSILVYYIFVCTCILLVLKRIHENLWPLLALYRIFICTHAHNPLICM